MGYKFEPEHYSGRYKNWFPVRLTTIKPEQSTEILDWCSDTFRSFDWTWALDGIYFRHEKDAVLFMLRWL